MNKQISIGDKIVKQDSLFIIAEVGNQFNGDYETARKLVDVCVEAGADAVKFIFWYPDEIMVDNPPYTYQTVSGEVTEPMFDLLNRFTLSTIDWCEVREYCLDKKIAFMSTVLSSSGVDMGRSLLMDAWKLSAWDANFPDLYEWVAAIGMPTILDVGACTQKELDVVVGIFNKWENDNLILMHCTHADKNDQMNMLAIPYLRDKHDCLVGYSPASNNDELDLVAIGLGACVIEKRLTLDRNACVLHDVLSKEPDEFKDYVERMRRAKESLGKYALVQSDRDLVERKKWFRHIVADEDIPIGETVTRDMLEAKRGEYGERPENIWQYVGRRTRRTLARNQIVKPEDFES